MVICRHPQQWSDTYSVSESVERTDGANIIALSEGRRSFQPEIAVKDFPALADEKYWKTGKPFVAFLGTEIKS